MAAIIEEAPRPSPLLNGFSVGKRPIARENAPDSPFVVEIDPHRAVTRLGACCDFERATVDHRPDERAIDQHRVGSPGDLGEITHDFRFCERWSGHMRQADQAE